MTTISVSAGRGQCKDGTHARTWAKDHERRCG